MPGNKLHQKLQVRDEVAVEELYRRYVDLARKSAFRVLRDRSMSDDVAQETLWRAWSKAAQFDEKRGSLAAWITSIAHNIAVDYTRSVFNSPAHENANRPNLCLSMEDSCAVKSALDRLHPVEKSVLTLMYYEGLSQAEVACVLRRPLGTVKTWARAGLAHLRDQLSPLSRLTFEGAKAPLLNSRTGTMNWKRSELLLRRALDHSQSAVAVSNNRGEFVLYNEAADKLFGFTDSVIISSAHSCTDRYGLYLPDGETPYPEQDLPLWRAIAGESTFRRLVLMKNARAPEGILVIASARPRLDSDNRIIGGILTCKIVQRDEQS